MEGKIRKIIERYHEAWLGKFVISRSMSKRLFACKIEKCVDEIMEIIKGDGI